MRNKLLTQILHEHEASVLTGFRRVCHTVSGCPARSLVCAHALQKQQASGRMKTIKKTDSINLKEWKEKGGKALPTPLARVVGGCCLGRRCAADIPRSKTGGGPFASVPPPPFPTRPPSSDSPLLFAAVAWYRSIRVHQVAYRDSEGPAW